MDNGQYYSFNKYLRDTFGVKVRRICLDAGFGCPNKDGTLGTGGCIYCNERGFSPLSGEKLLLEEQIDAAIRYHKENRTADKFIAYFQNATNTYAPVGELRNVYDVIRGYQEIVGLYISTRPDCADGETLDLVASYMPDYEVWVEYGVQTAHDRTLQLLNRCHLYADSVKAIKMAHDRGIKVCVHVMLGLPSESRDDMVSTARELSLLPVSGIKIHVMHVLAGTRLAELYRTGAVRLMSEDEYVGAVCDLLENIRPDIVIMRLVSDANRDVLIAPNWINNKLSVINHIEKELSARGTCQGFNTGC